MYTLDPNSIVKTKQNHSPAGEVTNNKTAEITQAMGNLYSALERNETIIRHLNDILTSVTRPALPVSTEEDAAGENGFLTPLASDIDYISTRLRDQTNSLEDLYDRIELSRPNN
jgi:hypothetical protein